MGHGPRITSDPCCGPWTQNYIRSVLWAMDLELHQIRAVDHGHIITSDPCCGPWTQNYIRSVLWAMDTELHQIRAVGHGHRITSDPCCGPLTVPWSGCVTPSHSLFTVGHLLYLGLAVSRYTDTPSYSLFTVGHLLAVSRYTDSPSYSLFTVGHLLKLQTLVYDILPSTTAVFSYAIGSRKLSANEQFFIGAQTVVTCYKQLK